jgi:HEAT repeat protein
MSIKFLCTHCGHKLKAAADKAGKHCRCPQCAQVMTIPDAPVAKAPKRRVLLIVASSVAAGLLMVAAGIAVIVLLTHQDAMGRELADLKGGPPEARAQALAWVAQADPQDADRARVTAALEPLLVDGDLSHDLNPDLLLRAYLHWAGPDNVPAMIRMVDDPTLPAWNPRKTGLVMEALGKLQDKRAIDALVQKLPDPVLHDQAVSGLRLMGPDAENAVLKYFFDGDPDTRTRAGQLLQDYGTAPDTIAAETRRLLLSNRPDVQCAAAGWLAETPPADDAQRVETAKVLAGLLDNLSPRVNGLALRALKLWATRDCLPQLVEFARRQEKAAPSKEVAAIRSVLIDVLAQFPDETAAEAIAPQLKDAANRAKAAQALVKLGPAATGAVLHYLNYPDADVQKEARSLCRSLQIPADRQLEQTLADVPGPSKPRSRAALQHLARLRPDEASRALVSRALNAPLLDPDPGIREDALAAVQVWATNENTATLLKILGSSQGGGRERGARTLEQVGTALIAVGPGAEEAVLPLLQSPDEVVLCAVCRVLGEIGTGKSVQPLQLAAEVHGGDIYNQAQVALGKITARK